MEMTCMTTLSPQDLNAIRHSLLYQFAPHPVAASDLWNEMEASAVLMPTGEELISLFYTRVSLPTMIMTA